MGPLQAKRTVIYGAGLLGCNEFKKWPDDTGVRYEVVRVPEGKKRKTASVIT